MLILTLIKFIKSSMVSYRASNGYFRRSGRLAGFCWNFPFQMHIPCEVSFVLWKGTLGVLLLGWDLMVSVFITEESVSWLLLSFKQKKKIKLKMEILFFKELKS